MSTPARSAFEVEKVDVSQLPRPHTQIMMNVGSPDIAFKQAAIPNDGVGLAWMEFIFANWVQVHPLALTRYATLPAEGARPGRRRHRGLRRQDELLRGQAGPGHCHHRRCPSTPNR